MGRNSPRWLGATSRTSTASSTCSPANRREPCVNKRCIVGSAGGDRSGMLYLGGRCPGRRLAAVAERPGTTGLLAGEDRRSAQAGLGDRHVARAALPADPTGRLPVAACCWARRWATSTPSRPLRARSSGRSRPAGRSCTRRAWKAERSSSAASMAPSMPCNAATAAWPGSSRASLSTGFSTAVLLAEGKVFIANRGGVYYALRQSDGKPVWQRDLGVPILMSSAYADGRLFFGAMDMRVYALDAKTGEIAWKSDDALWRGLQGLLARGLQGLRAHPAGEGLRRRARAGHRMAPRAAAGVRIGQAGEDDRGLREEPRLEEPLRARQEDRPRGLCRAALDHLHDERGHNAAVRRWRRPAGDARHAPRLARRLGAAGPGKAPRRRGALRGASSTRRDTRPARATATRT